MALNTNAIMKFIGYEILDDGIVACTFLCLLPGAGEPSNYVIHLSDSEITGSTLAQLKTLVTQRLQRKFRSNGLSTYLDGLIGQDVTI